MIDLETKAREGQPEGKVDGCSAMPHKMHPLPAFTTKGGWWRFGFPAGYLAHLPPPSCGAKGLWLAARAERRVAGMENEDSLPLREPRYASASICSSSISEILICSLIHGEHERRAGERELRFCLSNERTVSRSLRFG